MRLQLPEASQSGPCPRRLYRDSRSPRTVSVANGDALPDADADLGDRRDRVSDAIGEADAAVLNRTARRDHHVDASGRGPMSSRQRTHSPVVGHVLRCGPDPTTIPKCPARRVDSNTSARGAAPPLDSPDGRGAGRCRRPRPTNARIGHDSSARLTAVSLDDEPPGHHPVVDDELLEQLRDGRPDHATHRPAPGTGAAARAVAARPVVQLAEESNRDLAVFTGSSNWNPVRAIHPAIESR